MRFCEGKEMNSAQIIDENKIWAEKGNVEKVHKEVAKGKYLAEQLICMRADSNYEKSSNQLVSKMKTSSFLWVSSSKRI